MVMSVTLLTVALPCVRTPPAATGVFVLVGLPLTRGVATVSDMLHVRTGILHVCLHVHPSA